MSSKFQESQRSKAIGLINSGNWVFDGALGGKYFMKSNRAFVLTEHIKNLYKPIRKEVLDYFRNNQVAWWGGSGPTGHVLSSQIACVNFLFQIRYDEKAVLALVQNINPNFINVLRIDTDKHLPGFIQFEAVSKTDLLNEGKPNRGNNCTSIDALILAEHSDHSIWLIPIEWKYTEHYENLNKAKEGIKTDPINGKGIVRQKRYTTLINESKQLISVDHTCYYYEPFYQLMRQSLWAEQMIANKEKEVIKADNYIHIHVIPSTNLDLLGRKYKCSGMDMESTWRSHLIDQSKYLIISPEQLMNPLNSIPKYADLLNYLKVRYY